MAENTDSRDEALEGSRNAKSEKISNENIPSVDSDNIPSALETENMETHAHHLHHAPGKKFWHYIFEFLMLFLAVFCGFIAENWREQLREHQRKTNYPI
jgi:hypothetical protein